MRHLLLLTLLVAGCAAAPPPLSVPEPPSADSLLPVLAVYAIPAAADARCRSCQLNVVSAQALAQALTRTERFEAVGAALERAEYALTVSSMSRPDGQLQATTTLYWFDEPIERLQYALPAAEAGQLAALLVRDLQVRQSFSTPHLHAVLESSRYADDLSAAARIGAFDFSAKRILHNPMHGASLRYLHGFYENTHADVFVYPVPHWQFDQPQLVDAEIAALRGDFVQLEARGMWRDLTLEPVRTLRADSGQSSDRILTFDAEFRTDSDLLMTSTYVYLLGDKFVKVRATYPKFTPVQADVEAFARTLPASLEVPAQSAFMARLRRDWQQDNAAQADQEN